MAAQLTDKQELFLEWLLDPQRAASDPRRASMRALAGEIGVHERTLSKWKKDPVFCREWEKRAYQDAANPQNIQDLLSVTLGAAKGGDLKAVELYMKLVDRMTPDKVVLQRQEESLDNLSDDELEALAAAKATDQLAARRATPRAEPDPAHEAGVATLRALTR